MSLSTSESDTDENKPVSLRRFRKKSTKDVKQDQDQPCKAQIPAVKEGKSAESSGSIHGTPIKSTVVLNRLRAANASGRKRKIVIVHEKFEMLKTNGMITMMCIHRKEIVQGPIKRINVSRLRRHIQFCPKVSKKL